MLLVGLLLLALIITSFVKASNPHSYSLNPLVLLVVSGTTRILASSYFNSPHQKQAFGRNEYFLPENFKTLRRKDIPVTYRLHDDLLRYYRKGTRPVTHPNKIINVTMSVFLYQIIKLVSWICLLLLHNDKQTVYAKSSDLHNFPIWWITSLLNIYEGLFYWLNSETDWNI